MPVASAGATSTQPNIRSLCTMQTYMYEPGVSNVRVNVLFGGAPGAIGSLAMMPELANVPGPLYVSIGPPGRRVGKTIWGLSCAASGGAPGIGAAKPGSISPGAPSGSWMAPGPHALTSFTNEAVWISSPAMR